MKRYWETDFGRYAIPDDITFHARSDGLLDRRYSRQNAAFVAWLKEQDAAYIRAA